MGLEHLQSRCSVLSEAKQAWHGRAKQAYCQYVDAARQSHAQVQPAQNATYGLKVLKWADAFRMLGRRILVVALVPYVLWLAFAYRYHLVDGVNLVRTRRDTWSSGSSAGRVISCQLSVVSQTDH